MLHLKKKYNTSKTVMDKKLRFFLLCGTLHVPRVVHSPVAASPACRRPVCTPQLLWSHRHHRRRLLAECPQCWRAWCWMYWSGT